MKGTEKGIKPTFFITRNPSPVFSTAPNFPSFSFLLFLLLLLYFFFSFLILLFLHFFFFRRIGGALVRQGSHFEPAQLLV